MILFLQYSYIALLNIIKNYFKMCRMLRGLVGLVQLMLVQGSWASPDSIDQVSPNYTPLPAMADFHWTCVAVF
jgi:hypothetical protein